MGSHSVTCHPTQVNTPRLNHSQTGRYSIDLPRRMEGWLDLGDRLHTEMVYPPAHRRSPVQVLTRQSTARNRAHDLLVTSPTPYQLHYQATCTVYKKGRKKVKANIALPGGTPPQSYGKSLTTRHKWTRPAWPQPCRLVLNLPTPEGWKAELT